MKRPIYAIITFVLFLFLAVSFAKDPSGISDDASKLANQIFGATDNQIPKWLLDKAEAVVIAPDYNKNENSEGIFSVRTDNTWSLPSIAQIRVTGPDQNKDISSLVFIFMKGKGSDELKKGNVIVSGGGLVPGPKGSQTEESFDRPDHDIVFAYSIDNKKASGAQFDQATITTDNSANKDLYKKDVTIDQIVNNKVSSVPEKAVKFQANLNGQSLKK